MVLHVCFPSLCCVFSCSYTQMRRSLQHAPSVPQPTSTCHMFSRRALPLILRLRLRFLAHNALTLDILAHPLIAPLSIDHDHSTTCMLALAPRRVASTVSPLSSSTATVSPDWSSSFDEPRK